MAILIIEDNAKLAQNIARYLEAERFATSVVGDGTAGLQKAMLETFDLVVLDLNLPGTDGMEICRRLRAAEVNTPIIMLTARTGSQNMVGGLNAGADDYLEKPFDLEVLLARVRALIRRQAVSKSPVLAAGPLEVDTNTHQVRLRGTDVPLAPKEYAVLEFLIRNKGIAQDRLTIIEHVWGEDADLSLSQTVDVHVAYLRRKLGKDAIATIPGKGYLIKDHEAAQ